jgi:hypothetical protein
MAIDVVAGVVSGSPAPIGRKLTYVRIPAPPASGRREVLVTVYDSPRDLRAGEAVRVRRGVDGWELVV